MEQKMPFYMMYPTPFLFDDERKEERDYAYLRSMYPEMAKRILPYVQEECERMAYDKSMLFDEYPDKLQLRLMCTRTCDQVRRGEKFSKEEEIRMRDMVELLLYQEILRRRCSHRKCFQKKTW